MVGENQHERATTAAELAERLSFVSRMIQSEPARARPELEHIVDAARTAGARSQVAAGLLSLTSCHFLVGNYTEMMTAATEAAEISRVLRSTEMEAHALNNIGLAEQRLGHLDKAAEYMLESLRLASQTSDERGIARALVNLGLVHAKLGAHDTARHLHEKALGISQVAGLTTANADALLSLLEDYSKLGEIDAALEIAPEAIQFPRQRGLSRYECYARTIHARLLLSLGRHEAAKRSARAGLRVARWTDDHESIVRLNLVYGRSVLALDEVDTATTLLNESADLAKQHGFVNDQILAAEALAELREHLGDDARAAEHRDTAAKLEADMLDTVTKRNIADATTAALGPNADETDHFTDLPWADELAQLTRPIRRANTDISHRLAHDPVTGALTREQLRLRLHRHIDLLGAEDIIGFVLISIDDFSTVRDIYGFPVGDALLGACSRRLRTLLRPGDMVARVESQSFAVVLSDLAHGDDIEAVMERIVTGLANEFVLRDQTVTVRPVLSGLIIPEDGDTIDLVLERSERSLALAREHQGLDVARYNTDLVSQRMRNSSLMHDLASAHERGQMELWYQPIMATADQKLVGFEALLRWHHPTEGLISPAVFIPMAEQSRDILELGDWALQRACEEAKAWELDKRGLFVAVNASAIQFAEPLFAEQVLSTKRRSGYEGQLIIELTESCVHDSMDVAHSHITRLREAGVSVYLDDFGTGFSSLSLLRDIQFDGLKIDRDLLRDLQTAEPGFERTRSLTNMVINLAATMDLGVVAEGVETSEQHDHLNATGCPWMQGFLLGRPEPAKSSLHNDLHRTPR